MTPADAPLSDDGFPEFAPPPWPGPGRYTLRAWVELELALERGARVDAAHALLDDDALIDQVLAQVRARMGEDDEAPDPPSEEYGWYAYSPGRRAR